MTLELVSRSFYKKKASFARRSNNVYELKQFLFFLHLRFDKMAYYMALKLLIVLILEISQLKNIYIKREVNSKIKSFFSLLKQYLIKELVKVHYNQ